VGYVVSTNEIRNAYKILVIKPQGRNGVLVDWVHLTPVRGQLRDGVKT
jgi:hypothetical protein